MECLKYTYIYQYIIRAGKWVAKANAQGWGINQGENILVTFDAALGGFVSNGEEDQPLVVVLT